MDKKLVEELKDVLKKVEKADKDVTLADILAALERIEEKIDVWPWPSTSHWQITYGGVSTPGYSILGQTAS